MGISPVSEPCTSWPAPELFSGPSLLVVAPHPDDDVLGCGALMARLAAAVPIRVVYVTDGSASHTGSPSYPPARLASVREDEALAALCRLGVASPPIFLRWGDGRVPSVLQDGAAFLIDALLAAIPPDQRVVIAAPWRRDPHPDHRAVAALVDAALAYRPQALRIEYAVWLQVRGTPTDAPLPHEHRVIEIDSRPWLEQKRAAVLEHRSQLGELIGDAVAAFQFPGELLASALGPVERFILPVQATA